MCGEFWLVRQRVFWFSDLLPHAKTRDRETTEFKMVLEMFGTGWTSCNEVIRHDAVRTTIPHSHHRVGIAGTGFRTRVLVLPSAAWYCFGIAAEQSHQRNSGDNGLRTLWFGGFLFAFLPGKTAQLFPHAPTGRYGGILGGTGIIGPCGNNSQFGFSEGRFRTDETELKLRSGFKSSSIAFAQVNKRE